MGRSISQKRPWLAAVLALFVTGLGHLYLRRWRRALGWLLALFGVSTLFVEPGALEAFASSGAVDPVAMAPVLLVGALSVVDAYLLAHVQNAAGNDPLQSDDATDPIGSDDDPSACPNCGKELDPDLTFCHWCTTEFDAPVGNRLEDGRGDS